MAIATRMLAYSDLDTTLTGVLNWNAAYTVLACDMYGDGVAGDRDRVIACVTALRDDPMLLARRAR